MEQEFKEFILETIENRTAEEMCEDVGFCVNLLTAVFQSDISIRNNSYNKDEESEGLKLLRKEFAEKRLNKRGEINGYRSL